MNREPLAADANLSVLDLDDYWRTGGFEERL